MVEKRNHQHGVRERLKVLAQRFPQAEIARRTGASPANVHRYLKEGKIPAGFCVALVEEFQVNPIWLMTGEGSVLRSEVRAPVGEIAGDLLELVETMNAVTRMRLGELTDKPEQKALRRLADAMSTFERLRDGLNTKTRPVMRTVLSELKEALEKMDLDRVGKLRQTANQLARLTLDDELLEELDAHNGAYYYLRGQVEKAIEFERRVFSRRIIEGSVNDEDGLRSALHLVMALRDTSRLEEARRVCRATLELTVDALRETTLYRQLQMFGANLDIDLGDLKRGMRVTMEVYPFLRDDLRLADILYMRATLVVGAVGWMNAASTSEFTAGRARGLVRYACLGEQQRELEFALQNFVGAPPKKLREQEFDVQFAKLLLETLRGSKRSVKHFDSLLAAHPPFFASVPVRNVIVPLHRAQIGRLAGQFKELKTDAEATEKAWLAMPESMTPKLDWLITHRLNLEAIPNRNRSKLHRDALQRVQAETDRLVAKGYRYLEPPESRA